MKLLPRDISGGNDTMKPRVAIACQGGGSQTAFTAGVLKALFENKVQDHFNIVSLSGTSGGPFVPFSSGMP